ncbi:MAG: hypothetical protein ABSF44_16240, partial [Candidatus Bathyarchaeia archaeon]
LGVFAVVMAYDFFGTIALITLRFTHSDEPYFVNMNLIGLAASICIAMGMVVIAVVFGVLLNLNVLSGPGALVPASFTSAVHGSVSALSASLGAVQIPTSYSTCLLNDGLYNYLMIAFGEEMLVFACVSALRDALGPLANREKHNQRIGKNTRIIIYFLLIGFCFISPVLLWSLWHGLESYANWWLIMPAFINGLLLLLLKFTKNVGQVKLGILAAIIAHGTYDSYITLSAYVQGSVSAKGLPLFPVAWSFADIYLVFLLGLALVCLAIPILLSGDK